MTLLDSKPAENCPVCASKFASRTADKVFPMLGQKKAVAAAQKLVYRDRYFCGAVVLINYENPQGLLEARCCTSMKSASL